MASSVARAMSDFAYRFVLRPFLVAFPAAGLALGFTFLAIGAALVRWIWAACARAGAAVLVVQIITSLRPGDVGLDIVRRCLCGRLVFGENWPPRSSR